MARDTATARVVEELVLRSAGGDPRWGCRRVQGGLARLGHWIGASTVWQIVTPAGVDPAPRGGGLAWREFLTAQADGVIARDFAPVDLAGLWRVYALVSFEHDTHRLRIAGATTHPTAQGSVQQARDLAAGLGVRFESGAWGCPAACDGASAGAAAQRRPLPVTALASSCRWLVEVAPGSGASPGYGLP